MSSTTSKYIPIETEWAETLISLRLKVPESWWYGNDRDKLYSDTVSALEFLTSRQYVFQFELNTEYGAFYPIRYDAVFTFKDAE